MKDILRSLGNKWDTKGVSNSSSVQFSCSVMTSSLWPHGLQHTRPPCLSPIPWACLNSCPLSRWCHPTISSSVIPFSSHLQSFPASGAFLISQFFVSGGQSIGVSASVLPMNIQDWFALGLTGWICLQSKGLSRIFSNTTVQNHQFFGAQLYGPTLTSIHDCWKNHSFYYMDFCWQSNVILLRGGIVCREFWKIPGNFLISLIGSQNFQSWV